MKTRVKHTKHGMSYSHIYKVWVGIRTRCYNPKNARYYCYGGRGIKVCDRWLESFINFRDDMADSYKDGLQLDRINNDGNYEPSNCRWVTASENMKNRQIKANFQSNVPNVYWNKSKQKWEFIRRFDSQEEAECFARGENK